MRRWGRWLAIGAIALVVLAVPPARATPVGTADGGRFAIAAPVEGGPQVRVVEAADGTAIYTQTWLPVARDGHVPPERLPTVVVYTPYATPGVPDAPDLIDLLVPQGYAVTFANVRGTGASGGCFTLAGPEEVDDGARVIEDAGVLAPWASETVGMFGASYPGGTQMATATGPDRERLSSLKALVVGAPPLGTVGGEGGVGELVRHRPAYPQHLGCFLDGQQVWDLSHANLQPTHERGDCKLQRCDPCVNA